MPQRTGELHQLMPEPLDPASPGDPAAPRETAAPRPPADASPAKAAFDACRMDALAFLAGGISHDLANPLGAMLTFASFLASDPRLPADLRDDARLLRAEADRTNRMIRTLLEFARHRPATTAQVSLETVIAEVLELEAYVLTDVDVRRALPADLPEVLADPSRLRHLLMVLSVEAVRNLGGRSATGSLIVAARTLDDGRVRVELVFERPAGAIAGANAVGGSPIDAARALAAEVGLDLTVTPTVTGGRYALTLPTATAPAIGASRWTAATGMAEAATAQVAWPAVAPTPVPTPPGGVPAGGTPAAAASSPAGALDGTSHTVLVCDDEDSVRSLLVRILTRHGFRVVPAATPMEALALLGTTHVDIVVTDHHMHGMSGIELFERVTGERPDLRSRFVMLTGDPGAEDLVRFANGAGVTVLAKPFEMNAIAAAIREVAQA